MKISQTSLFAQIFPQEGTGGVEGKLKRGLLRVERSLSRGGEGNKEDLDGQRGREKEHLIIENVENSIARVNQGLLTG